MNRLFQKQKRRANSYVKSEMQIKATVRDPLCPLE